VLKEKLLPIIKEILLLKNSYYNYIDIYDLSVMDSNCLVLFHTDESHYNHEQEIISVWEVILHLTNK
jgi:hypothetical protein